MDSSELFAIKSLCEIGIETTGRLYVNYDVQQDCLELSMLIPIMAITSMTYWNIWLRNGHSYAVPRCKAIFPVEEPVKPTAACSRLYNRDIVSGTNPQFLSLDHDYHICRLFPSVYLDVVIPPKVT
jgi:hypothetical protein